MITRLLCEFPAGLVIIDRLGEPMAVTICDLAAAYCEAVGYGLTETTMTVVCGDGGWLGLFGG
jgi:hypothetical protein